MRNKNQFTLALGFLIVAVMCGGFVASSYVVARPAAQSAGKWDAGGTYTLMGTTPNGFKGFQYFDLTTMTYTRSGSSKAIKPYGFVQAGRKYKMTRIDILGESLSFETAMVGGVSYQFNGRAVHPPNDADISGWLIKMVDGKKVAEAQVEFDFEEGG